MNLQENILRIKEVMRLNEGNENLIQYVQTQIDKTISELKGNIPSIVNSVFDTEEVINNFRNYLFSRIPEIIEKSKTGKGGDQFVQECYTKFMELIQNEINNISKVKKYALRMIPNKEEFLFDIGFNLNMNLINTFFVDVVDISTMLRLKNQYNVNIEEKMINFSRQIRDWFNHNENEIKKEIIKKIGILLLGSEDYDDYQKNRERENLDLNLVLKKGSKGNEVRELQNLLMKSLPPVLDMAKGTVTPQVNIDGDFGQETENALLKVKNVKSITLNQYNKK